MSQFKFEKKSLTFWRDFFSNNNHGGVKVLTLIRSAQVLENICWSTKHLSVQSVMKFSILRDTLDIILVKFTGLNEASAILNAQNKEF